MAKAKEVKKVGHPKEKYQVDKKKSVEGKVPEKK